ncbi:recombinase family protein [Enterobacter mori]|uniref:recombinase family protein n=1 Tax=Enterobacter mori TaxID=539813 RepID=UPI003B983CC5
MNICVLVSGGWLAVNPVGSLPGRPERVINLPSKKTVVAMLDVAQAGDVLLVEQVDRLSRLNAEDWQNLRGLITGKGVRVVALDLPTSHTLLQTGDEFTGRMMDTINGMMLDMLAAIARKGYTDRRRQAEGIEKARSGGLYKGKQLTGSFTAGCRRCRACTPGAILPGLWAVRWAR